MRTLFILVLMLAAVSLSSRSTLGEQKKPEGEKKAAATTKYVDKSSPGLMESCEAKCKQGDAAAAGACIKGCGGGSAKSRSGWNLEQNTKP